MKENLEKLWDGGGDKKRVHAKFFFFFPSINKKLSYFLSEDVELCVKA